MEDCICLEDLLKIGVIGSKAVVGRGRSAEEQPHGVPLIPKGGLHSDEDIAKLLAVDEQIIAIGVEVACRW